MGLKHIDEVMQVQDQIDHISCYDARLMANRDDTLFVDVRERSAFESGHITGSVHCDRGLLEFYVADGSPMQLSHLRGCLTKIILFIVMVASKVYWLPRRFKT